jgi:hypothetical protein
LPEQSYLVFTALPVVVILLLLMLLLLMLLLLVMLLKSCHQLCMVAVGVSASTIPTGVFGVVCIPYLHQFTDKV